MNTEMLNKFLIQFKDKEQFLDSIDAINSCFDEYAEVLTYEEQEYCVKELEDFYR